MLSYLSLFLVLFHCVSAGQEKHWLCVKTPPPRFRDLHASCPSEQCYSLHLFACYNEDCCALNIRPDGNASIPIFGRGINLATVTDIQINEASGLVASRLHAGVLYTHNDSGDRARIFAVDSEDGGTLAVYDIASATHHDWEDMAVGVCPSGSGSCIYIGDVGGNYGDAGSVKNIYVVEEPKVISGNDTLPLLAKLHYNWDVYDTETLMIDPTGDVILISKVQGGRGLVGYIPSIAFYTAQQFPFPQSYNITNSTTLNIPLTDDVDPLGGDISPNGREVVLRTHHKIYYWMVNNREYLTTLNTTEPLEVPQKKEPQGEAVSWDTRGEGYYTLSERENQPLYYFRRLF
ncbi:uncharacterized protein LOC133186749 [Saccostrea echinata]|uniref:uncharacterized protein LOC133186749 n=1 Tax=Saccostrea echinata TaxID=191078 RepID=UPI002A7F59AA|nr:uncharacterized protein LOC133186749 [Saccostrea echinata]